jgi:ribosomal protein S18 acetylase RimI-like enzyme
LIRSASAASATITPAAIEPGQPADLEAVTAFTRRTFDWGDYVPEAFLGWLLDPAGQAFVARDLQGTAIAVAHVQIVAPGEAWLEGARVHPDHRRRGLADALNARCRQWAKAQGALVARLATEIENTAARRQVENLGWHRVAHFTALAAASDRGDVSPLNASRADRFAVAERADVADLAWLLRRRDGNAALANVAAGLIGSGWRWKRSNVEDLEAAVVAGRAIVVRVPSDPTRGGYAVLDDNAEGARLQWVEAADADLPLVVTTALTLAGDLDKVVAILPAYAPLQLGAGEAGLQTWLTMAIYELAL